jgi:hypothetical protein
MKRDDIGRLFEDGPDPLKDPKLTPQRVRRTPTGDGDRFIGCRIWWFDQVYPLVRSKGELAVALYIFRLRAVQGSRTVVVPNTWLKVRGIDRHTKYRALRRLVDAGLIKVRQQSNEGTAVTFRGRARGVV